MVSVSSAQDKPVNSKPDEVSSGFGRTTLHQGLVLFGATSLQPQ